MGELTESVVEDAALAWLEAIEWSVTHGLEIAPGELAAERVDYGQVVLEARLRDAPAICDALLPKLISGELRVKDAERIVARHS